MRILLTNTTLAHRTGSELYVAEVARALRDRGCRPVVWSPVLGEVAAELAAAGIPVVDDLARVGGEPGRDPIDPSISSMASTTWRR